MVEDNMDPGPGALPFALTQRELAARWRISPRTLERWRANKTGPAWLKIGGCIIYRTADILAHERAHVLGGSSSDKAE